MTLDVARQVLETEAEAIRRLVDLIGEDFERAVDMVVACTGRVVWTGMGKSGIICHKLAATMRSTGTPALHLHPADAIHGDLGMVVAGDLVIAISHSGTTEEILRLVEVLKRQAIPLIAFTSHPDSPLAQAANLHLDLGVRREACPLNLAPDGVDHGESGARRRAGDGGVGAQGISRGGLRGAAPGRQAGQALPQGG